MRIIQLIALATSFLSSTAMAEVDLAIGDDEVYRRPNAWSDNVLKPADEWATSTVSRPGMSIAWRNANQVEEVEVRVLNLGNDPGEGRISVDIVDATGRILLSLSPPEGEEVVRVPARDKGGREGKVIRMKANWELNALIDRNDRTRTQYGVMATIGLWDPMRSYSTTGRQRRGILRSVLRLTRRTFSIMCLLTMKIIEKRYAGRRCILSCQLVGD